MQDVVEVFIGKDLEYLNRFYNMIKRISSIFGFDPDFYIKQFSTHRVYILFSDIMKDIERRVFNKIIKYYLMEKYNEDKLKDLIYRKMDVDKIKFNNFLDKIKDWNDVERIVIKEIYGSKEQLRKREWLW